MAFVQVGGRAGRAGWACGLVGLALVAAPGTLCAQVAVQTQGHAPMERTGGTIDLPTSKQILGVVPGGPQRLGSEPVTMAVSPDGRWVVTVDNGYGSLEMQYDQGFSVLDTRSGKVQEFPDARTGLPAKQTLFSGLAFSADGHHLYASLASTTDPQGLRPGDTGSGVAVYTFSSDGAIAAERVLKLPLVKLAAGHTTKLGKAADTGMPYPAAIAVDNGGCSHAHPCEDAIPTLLVAGNLSDDVTELDAATGSVVRRFDLAEDSVVPSTYPIDIKVERDGKRAFVALWNASEVVELDLRTGRVGRKLTLLKGNSSIAPGSHPVSLLMSPDGRTLYVALSNRDAVAAVDLEQGRFALKGYFDARLPGQSFYGAEPESLAISPDGRTLYAADMGSDAIAVWETAKLSRSAVRRGMVEPAGFIPTEWLPMALGASAGKLYIATGKGTGTGPNNFKPTPTPAIANNAGMKRSFTYIGTLLHGSLAVVDTNAADLKAMTAVVLESNRMKAAEERIAWNPAVLARAQASAETRPGMPADKDALEKDYAPGRGPIKHVIYIIRENRTYDQILGDLKDANGKPAGNGDPSLAMYGEATTPNLHKLALQFGVLDNFYDSAEVSGDGHVWSNTAIGTDYLERTWQIDYRGRERGYDYEGVVSQGLPIEQHIPDVNEPSSGYIWGNVARHGLTLIHFGEYINSTFCNDKEGSGEQRDPTQGPMGPGRACAPQAEVKPGQPLPAVWGGEVNKFAWPVPLLATNKATKPELVGHFVTEYPDFNLRVPDQVRANIFIKHLNGWIADRNAGHDTMPNFVMLRFANDHTAGTTPGGPTPKSSIADNDLAVGRAVEAISHSPYWDDTAFFILEDDAQNGADHVDAHRSIGVVVSKYAPHGVDGAPVVDSRFYSTVSMVRTMETVLGLPPMTNNDALSSMIGTLFTGPGDQSAFTADRSNDLNGLIYTANKASAPGAKESAKMDFRHADRANAMKLNVILWQDAMGSAPTPAMLMEKRRKSKKDDDDD
jgi:DNA-binding beta-propeller fold protein YncE